MADEGSHGAVPGAVQELPPGDSPDLVELSRQLHALRALVLTRPPDLLAALQGPELALPGVVEGEKDRCIAIQERAIDELAGVVEQYVAGNWAGLLVRSPEFLLTNFADMFGNLRSLERRLLADYFDTLAESLRRIQQLKHLPQGQRETMIARAAARAEALLAERDRAHDSILATIEEMVRGLVAELGHGDPDRYPPEEAQERPE